MDAFIDTPMRPEYPCAHCIVASAVATVLRAELGAAPTPTLTHGQRVGELAVTKILRAPDRM